MSVVDGAAAEDGDVAARLLALLERHLKIGDGIVIISWGVTC